MPETGTHSFLALSRNDQRDVLTVASDLSGQPAFLLEKDLWVVWVLSTLFSSSIGSQLIFKGGTSLSKAYRAINRFSEDIDLTIDIRSFIPEAKNCDGLPSSRSQGEKWVETIYEQLPIVIQKKVIPALQSAIEHEGLELKIEVKPEIGDKVSIHYLPLHSGPPYISPTILLEFGAKSTGEPHETIPIVCDLQDCNPAIAFPVASPQVMRIERTFWEKITAIHVFCRGAKIRGGSNRVARHWYDVLRLASHPFVNASIHDKTILKTVVDHKISFFPENDQQGHRINYTECLIGKLQLVPVGERLAIIREDYRQMIDGYLLYGSPQNFDGIIQGCAELENTINSINSE